MYMYIKLQKQKCTQSIKVENNIELKIKTKSDYISWYRK